MFSHDRAVRLTSKIAHGCGMPVITPRHTADGVHALLDDGPRAGSQNHKRMQVQLKAVANRVVIDSRCQATCARQFVAIESCAHSKATKLIWRANRIPAAPPAYRNSQFRETRIQSSFQSSHHRSRYPRGVPVHAHYAAESLEPEGIAKPGKKFRRSVR